MSLPKRRHSKTRRDKRRANTKVKAPGLSVCPECKLPKRSHTVCPSCGMYKGAQVVNVKQDEEKDDKK